MTSDWSRRSPSQSSRSTEQIRGVETDRLHLNAVSAQGVIALHAKRNDAVVQKIVSSIAGMPIPVTPNSAEFGARTILWLAPAYWLLLVGETETAMLCERLQSACSGASIIAADASDAKTVFDLAGDSAPILLSKLCALDFESSAMAPGRCAQSKLVRIPVTILHTLDQHAYRLIVDRSFAHYAWALLTDAAGEFTSSGAAS